MENSSLSSSSPTKALKIFVGLESHIAINSKRKLFCNCLCNKAFCEICRGLAGALPQKVNLQSYTKAITLAKVLNAKVNYLKIYRKHYRYLDLPNGFQRTQHPKYPLFYDGSLFLLKTKKGIKCKGFLEEDPAAIKGQTVNFLRCGCPLVEVVTQKLEGTYEDLKKLILEYLRTLKKICLDLNISNSSKVLKTDLNVSILNSPRYEIKNITSFKGIITALAQSIPLLVQDTSAQNKTFSYENSKLTFSRLKTQYLFSKEWNLKTFNLAKKVAPPVTLYYLLNTNMPYEDLKYQLFKKLLKAYTESKISYSTLINLAHLEPKKANLRLEHELRDSSALEPYVDKFLETASISKYDFDNKTKLFLESLKLLKRKLSAQNVKFSSLILNEIIKNKLKE